MELLLLGVFIVVVVVVGVLWFLVREDDRDLFGD